MKLFLTLPLLLLPAFACRTQTPESEVKVTNGIENQLFPATVFVYSDVGQCTGTFIGDQLLLTAAHCVDQAKWIRILKNGQSIAATRFLGHSFFGNPRKPGKNDVGLAWFPVGTAPASLPLCRSEPKAGDSVRLVGYGCNDITSFQPCKGGGMLRTGRNNLDSVVDGKLNLTQGIMTATAEDTALGEKSLTGSGDSGGPWIVGECIAGVTSGGWSTYSTAASVTYPSVVDFLKLNNAYTAAPAGSLPVGFIPGPGVPDPLPPSPPPLPPPPVPLAPYVNVESFDIDKKAIKAGETVKLTWRAPRARKVELLANGEFVSVVNGDMGGASHSPTVDTVYSIRYEEERGGSSEYIFTHTVKVTQRSTEDLLDQLLDQMQGS